MILTSSMEFLRLDFCRIPRSIEEWERNVYKRKRALGVEFMGVEFKKNNGKVLPCRKTGPPCGCKKNHCSVIP